MNPTVRLVADYFGIPEAVLLGPSQVHSVSYARHLCWWLLRRHCHECGHGCGMSIADIGRMFSRRSSTVQHGIQRIGAELRAGNVETIYDVSDFEMEA